MTDFERAEVYRGRLRQARRIALEALGEEGDTRTSAVRLADMQEALEKIARWCDARPRERTASPALRVWSEAAREDLEDDADESA